MEEKIYDATNTMDDTHWWFIGRRKIIKTILNKYIERIDSLPLDILEIGSGTGGNLIILNNYGNVTGVEMSSTAIEFSKKRIGNNSNITIYQSDNIDWLLSENKRYDIICLFDVLEHIENDGDFLNSLKQLLNVNGKIVLTVPAYNFLWSNHDTSHHHFRRYRACSLKQIYSKFDFTIEKLSYFNTLLFPLAVIDRLKSKITKNESSQNLYPSDTLNKVFKTFFLLEGNFIDKFSFPFGLSIVSVIKVK